MLIVTARPKLGERRVKLTHVTDWIEKKLKQEFKVNLISYLVDLELSRKFGIPTVLESWTRTQGKQLQVKLYFFII